MKYVRVHVQYTRTVHVSVHVDVARDEREAEASHRRH